MSKFVKLFWVFSLVGFLGALLFSYTSIPEKVDIALGSTMVSSIFLSRDVFFYLMVGIMVFTNATLLTMAKVLNIIPVKTHVGFTEGIINWLGSFSVILNLFYSITALIVGFYNNPAYNSSTHYNYLAYIGLVLILVWVLGLVYVLAQKNKVKASALSQK